MAARLSQELIDQVRSANDIVDVISERIQVRKAGRNYRALCPFHQEKTPSFNVSPERQIYHCFGCGVGGNVITFLMEYEKLTFPEALRELAERAGIALPRLGGSRGPRRIRSTRRTAPRPGSSGRASPARAAAGRGSTCGRGVFARRR